MNNPATGLVYLNNRHYDPTTGTFLSVDPLVTKTMQPYVYGAANPITNSDPDGLQPCSFTACPDGIPVVHNGKSDHRSWAWPILEERSTPTDHTEGGRRKDYEKRAAQHDAWMNSAPGAALPSWQLPFVLGYSSPDALDRAVNGPNYFENCSWACAVATGLTGGLSFGVAGAVCLETAGLVCAPAVIGATGVTSVVYEATSTDADGGDLVCAFFVGPSDSAAGYASLVFSGALTGVGRGVSKVAGDVLQNVFVGRAGATLC